MSDTSQNSESSRSHETIVDPAPDTVIRRVGIYFILLSVLLLYLLITTWPVPDFGGTVFRPVNIFGFSHTWAPERHLMFTVMVSGAMGSLAHSLTSFADYVGNRKLGLSWIWFLILRVPVGIAIALLFYFIVRGGILIPTVQVQPQTGLTPDTATKINPYAIAGFAALAGMFSKQATDKLAALFDVVFAMKDPVQRTNGLNIKPPSISSFDPAQLDKSSKTLTIYGQGFQEKCMATVEGKERKPSSVTDKKIVVPLDPGDVAVAPATLKVVVKNQDGGVAESSIKVV
ncbi:IPT/TIG domain-containing protein [Bradyrhizobium lablabi]|uniref:IPT/TIG domain-containing protein n=1 Tax=Bradyrhizobium lablabi TaxID=722472 RepID=UPI001BACB9E2|nr:IPT/TIG domain-containing protein [Bradyrhizobium lablabi]MBR1120226.1 IPT/TIG domain-containing protein [Bradyrhizobium lablabi]